jgi:hypothetical protein
VRPASPLGPVEAGGVPRVCQLGHQQVAGPVQVRGGFGQLSAAELQGFAAEGASYVDVRAAYSYLVQDITLVVSGAAHARHPGGPGPSIVFQGLGHQHIARHTLGGGRLRGRAERQVGVARLGVRPVGAVGCAFVAKPRQVGAVGPATTEPLD